MERWVGIIKVGTFLQVVHLHLSWRNIAVLNTYLAVLLFVIDVIIVQHRLHLHLGRVGKNFVTVQTILIDRNVAVQCQLEDIGKQVQLFVDGLHGIVESGIGVFVEVYLAIDVTTPNHVFRHVHSSRKHQTGTHRHALVLRLHLLLLLLLSLLLATSLWLRHNSSCCQRYHQ